MVAVEAVPAPAALTALNCRVYCVPFAKLLTVKGLLAWAGTKAEKLVPPLVEY